MPPSAVLFRGDPGRVEVVTKKLLTEPNESASRLPRDSAEFVSSPDIEIVSGLSRDG